MGSRKNRLHPFDEQLLVSAEELECQLAFCPDLPWADFLLNPRRLRGSDFLMRWSQGVWSEERLREAANRTGQYYAISFGPSSTAPTNDVQAYEQYFDRLEKAGLGKVKKPDLLLYRSEDKELVDGYIAKLGGEKELPFVPESDEQLRHVVSHAILAVECENSLWKAEKMPDFGSKLTPQKRLGGKLGLKKTAVVPTVIMKEEDRKPLRRWQRKWKKKIHIWHVFYDRAFGISFDKVEKLIKKRMILATEQVFQAPGGATTKKSIYKVYYHHAYELGTSVEQPSLVADSITDKNGHILPFVRFEGGTLSLAGEALAMLAKVT